MARTLMWVSICCFVFLLTFPVIALVIGMSVGALIAAGGIILKILLVAVAVVLWAAVQKLLNEKHAPAWMPLLWGAAPIAGLLYWVYWAARPLSE